MSMHNYPIYEFGLMLFDKDNEVDAFIEKYNQKNNTEMGFMDVAIETGAVYYDDEVDGVSFFVEETHNFYEYVTGLFFPANNQPEPYKAAYSSVDEIIEEFEYLKDYLPEGFDFKSHIGTYQGSEYS